MAGDFITDYWCSLQMVMNLSKFECLFRFNSSLLVWEGSKNRYGQEYGKLREIRRSNDFVEKLP
jgi:hypothetical protein